MRSDTLHGTAVGTLLQAALLSFGHIADRYQMRDTAPALRSERTSHAVKHAYAAATSGEPTIFTAQARLPGQSSRGLSLFFPPF